MNETLQGQLEAMGNEVLAAAIPDDCKRAIGWCLEQLPDYYDKFNQTRESRHVDEITRHVQGILKELAPGKKSPPESQQLASSITERFQLLHEQFGLPRLILRAPRVPPSRTRKAG